MIQLQDFINQATTVSIALQPTHDSSGQNENIHLQKERKKPTLGYCTSLREACLDKAEESQRSQWQYGGQAEKVARECVQSTP